MVEDCTKIGQDVVERAEIAVLPSLWRPIESAPQNHFPILLYGEYGMLIGFRDVLWEWWPVPAHERLGYMPTHWMPLPEPPK